MVEMTMGRIEEEQAEESFEQAAELEGWSSTTGMGRGELSYAELQLGGTTCVSPATSTGGSSACRLIIATYNVLCPAYKRERHVQGGRESGEPSLWRVRLRRIISELQALRPRPDIICVQEFWFRSESLVLFEESLSQLYAFHTAKRPGKKEDGLATLLLRSSPHFQAARARGTLVNLVAQSDRIGLDVRVPLAQARGGGGGSELCIFNTHLSFPHGISERQLQVNEARAIARRMHSLPADCAIALVIGDFNAAPLSRTLQQLSNAGFMSCLSKVHGVHAAPTTHLNHLGRSVCVDHVLLRVKACVSRRFGCKPREKSISHDTSVTSSPVNSMQLQTHSTAVFTPVAATVLPRHLPADVWPSTHTTSDHRPVLVELAVSSTPVSPISLHTECMTHSPRASQVRTPSASPLMLDTRPMDTTQAVLVEVESLPSRPVL